MQLTIQQHVASATPTASRRSTTCRSTVAPGMFGLLGPNGAGKSTLMRTLATLQEADSGSATLDDIDVLRDKDRVRRILGYLPQDFGVYPKVSAQEHARSLRAAEGHHRRERAQGDRRGAARAHQPRRGAQAEAGRIFRRHAAALRHRAGADRQSAPHHRRRAHRGPRSRGARALPQPARGTSAATRS